MTSRWRFLLACGCVLTAAVGAEPRAQTPGEGAAPAAPTTPQTQEQKVPWWGGRFALYLETGLQSPGSPLVLEDGCALLPQGPGFSW